MSSISVGDRIRNKLARKLMEIANAKFEPKQKQFLDSVPNLDQNTENYKNIYTIQCEFLKIVKALSRRRKNIFGTVLYSCNF